MVPRDASLLRASAFASASSARARASATPTHTRSARRNAAPRSVAAFFLRASWRRAGLCRWWSTRGTVAAACGFARGAWTRASSSSLDTIGAYACARERSHAVQTMSPRARVSFPGVARAVRVRVSRGARASLATALSAAASDLATAAADGEPRARRRTRVGSSETRAVSSDARSATFGRRGSSSGRRNARARRTYRCATVWVVLTFEKHNFSCVRVVFVTTRVVRLERA